MAETAPQQQIRRRRRAAAALLAGGLLAACSSPQDSGPGESAPSEQAAAVEYDPQPQVLDEPLPEADAGDAQLPTQFTGRALLETDWGTPPQEADGVFLAPGDTGGKLTFTAVDSEGIALWEAERPLSCTGFTLTTDEDQTLAILSDIDENAEGSPLGAPTVTAYDLHTGEEVWGPVEVPGPHQGPGMLFAAPPEESFGELGPAVVLDPATGEILFDERDDEELRVLGEHHSTVLVAEEDELRGYSAGAADPEWAVALTDLGWQDEPLRATAGQNSGQVTAMLIGPSADDRALVDLQSGQMLGESLREAGQDPSSGTWLTLGDDLTGIDPDGVELFSAELDEDMSVEIVGGVLAYLRGADQLHIYNVVTGDQAHAYEPGGEGPLAVPTHITGTGVGALEIEDRLFLAAAEGPDDL